MPFALLQSGSAGSRRWPFLCLAAAGGAIVVGLTAGCSQHSSGGSPDQAATAEAPAVKVVYPEKKDVRRMIERPGFNIEAYERTAIYAKVAGYVRKWNVDMGDTVQKNDVLAELYVPEMDVELSQKEAAVGQAVAEVKQADAAVLRAGFELQRAQGQYERLARAGRGGVLGKDEVEEYRLGFEAAQAAQAKAQADVDVAKARQKYAETDREHVRTLLQYTKIRAPFNGIVTRRTVNTGDFVQPAAANKGESLFVVEQIKPVRVVINLPDSDAVWVRDGDVALIRVPSLHGKEFQGAVTRASKSLNPQNRTLRTEVDLANDDGKLLPGTFVNAAITAQHKNVWALPATAVATQGEQVFCYWVQNGKAARTAIQVGLRGSDLVEVLKIQTKAGDEVRWEDLTGKEMIVASDLASMVDGRAVSVSSGEK